MAALQIFSWGQGGVSTNKAFRARVAERNRRPLPRHRARSRRRERPPWARRGEAGLAVPSVRRQAEQHDHRGVGGQATVCSKLWDRTAHAFAMIDRWAALNDEFGRRAAFALLASCALHRRGSDADYLARLPLIEATAGDERNFVRKGVNWALRAIGGKIESRAARRCARPRRQTRRFARQDRALDRQGRPAHLCQGGRNARIVQAVPVLFASSRGSTPAASKPLAQRRPASTS